MNIYLHKINFLYINALNKKNYLPFNIALFIFFFDEFSLEVKHLFFFNEFFDIITLFLLITYLYSY